MKKISPLILVFAVLFLVFLQAAGTLVESIYILNLLQAALNAKALGVLFFFAPLLGIPFYRKFPRGLIWTLFTILLLARGVLPYVDTSNRAPAAGLAASAALSLIFLLLIRNGGESRGRIGLWASAGFGLAVSLSVLLRTVGLGIEYSLTPSGGWVGWALGLLLGGALTLLDLTHGSYAEEKDRSGVTAGVVGLILILTLIWFSFSAPGIFARWTEGDYTLIVTAVALLSAGWVLLMLLRPQWIDRIRPRELWIWNVLFTLSLAGTVLAHRVAFPSTPDSAPVVVSTPGGWSYIPLALMLLLFPVVLLDLVFFVREVAESISSPADLVPGILLGGFFLILLAFIQIFTNVWGYVPPVSPPFRNLFWLPYLLAAGGITLLVGLSRRTDAQAAPAPGGAFSRAWGVLLGGIVAATTVSAFPARPGGVPDADRSSLTVMTINVQQFNDMYGEKSYERQLDLIRSVSPDILAMQETDSTRISLNNNDYVRHFAERLGYHSYYGPTTVAGTFGTAILSKYPLRNTRTVFTYSDTDEIGSAEAEIEVDGRRIFIYVVHPDGTDAAMLAFTRGLLDRIRDRPYVIALGDYNLRDYEEAYRMIDSVLVNAWTSVYPSKLSPEGVDLAGENRIDHILFSPNLAARNPVYVLPPDSATDHPVHWTEIYWPED
ncbi:MAG: endonuclease/exonuclease/phosphatase family protein [Anaerolineales bacterium]|nr:endonuclease/exonuclease/phosphatase family protein [Anaerolineales bacterium]